MKTKYKVLIWSARNQYRHPQPLATKGSAPTIIHPCLQHLTLHQPFLDPGLLWGEIQCRGLALNIFSKQVFLKHMNVHTYVRNPCIDNFVTCPPSLMALNTFLYEFLSYPERVQVSLAEFAVVDLKYGGVCRGFLSNRANLRTARCRAVGRIKTSPHIMVSCGAVCRQKQDVLGFSSTMYMGHVNFGQNFHEL